MAFWVVFRLVLIDLENGTATQICNGQIPGGVAGDITSCQLDDAYAITNVGDNILVSTRVDSTSRIMAIEGNDYNIMEIGSLLKS